MSRTKTRFPHWLKKRLPTPQKMAPVSELLDDLHLNTVCREAHCPNRGECYACGTATFMILGRVCTRNCRFCAVEDGCPQPVDPAEPARIAEATARLGLSHVVVTSVTRDDLPDGGSTQFAKVIQAVHQEAGTTVEVLIPDFQGDRAALQTVLDAGPEVFNHNVETVTRLYSEVRPQADYARSLAVLRRGASHPGPAIVKSGLMLGLGERDTEVVEVLHDLREAGCRVVTLGQYLAPSKAHHPVVEFVHPDQFAAYRDRAEAMGFEAVASGPFVRSSYGAAELASELLEHRRTTQKPTYGRTKMAIEVKLPDLGEDAGDEAEVSFWYVEEGESVEEGDDLVEMVTEKAAFTVPAPQSGTVTQIRAGEGDTVHVGDVMAVMEE